MLTGKRTCITGGASGLGLAIAGDIVAQGGTVFLLDRDEVALSRARDQIGADGVVVDVAEETQVANAVAAAAEALGGINGLVVSAGVQLHADDGPIGDVSLQTWERTVGVNMTGAFLTMRAAMPYLIDAGRGSVVLIGSPTGITMSGAGYAAYSASKAGMMGLARAAAADYADRGVRTNVVVPGTMETPLTQDLVDDPATRASLLRGTPLGRLGRPDDIVGLVSWLLSDAAGFATGGIFAVDGGLTAR